VCVAKYSGFRWVNYDARLEKAGFEKYMDKVISLLKTKAKHPDGHRIIKRLIRTGDISFEQRRMLLNRLKAAGFSYLKYSRALSRSILLPIGD
jgi:hypothetical protein